MAAHLPRGGGAPELLRLPRHRQALRGAAGLPHLRDGPLTAYYLKAHEAVSPEERPVPRKWGPIGAATDHDLVGHIRRVLAESPFTGEGYRKVWTRLRHQGIRTAAERVRRLMREQASRQGGNAHGTKAHDGTITTEEPDVMWAPPGR